MKRFLLLLTSAWLCLNITAQPRYDYSRLSMERLDRGVVAVRQSDGKVFISWRILRDDPDNAPFNVYRNGEKLNDKPLTDGGSYFIDEHPLQDDAIYEVRMSSDAQPIPSSVLPPPSSFLLPPETRGYLPVAICKPEGGKVPVMQGQQRQGQQRQGRRGWGWRDTGEYSYTANDATVADVDGDGQYEIILKWEPTNAHDNSHDGYTGPTLLDCYKLFPNDTVGSQIENRKSEIENRKSVNSQLLWRIDLGRNIRSGAHYTPFIVYDFDGDGRAELMVKTADGTRDGQGNVIGDSLADYRNAAGRILEGPEYISVFDGLTGRVLDTKPYIPERGELKAWGDERGNRSERYLAGVGYFAHESHEAYSPHEPHDSSLSTLHSPLPSALFCRGYYTRTVIAAWDWDGHELKNRWTFDTNKPEWASYAGQGNHNLRVADVDGDGFDEIIYGAMTVDHDGTGLYNTGMGHGDALHLVADPADGHLYVWDCHENRRDGSELHHAATGEVVFQIKSNADVGRCMAADIDPTSPGVEMWSADSHGIRNMKGEETHPQPLPVRDGSNYSQPSVDHEVTVPLHYREGQGGGSRISINFGIWWDGDLLRELLDRETVTKYDWENRQIIDLQRFDGQFNNGTKSNPCLSADILGDWREEVIIRNRESTELRIYVSTIPTPYRINCLMQDIPYRLSVATENVGYNQPPEPGFYLGPDNTSYTRNTP